MDDAGDDRPHDSGCHAAKQNSAIRKVEADGAARILQSKEMQDEAVGSELGDERPEAFAASWRPRPALTSSSASRCSLSFPAACS
jgi:hypothetical protein